MYQGGYVTVKVRKRDATWSGSDRLNADWEPARGHTSPGPHQPGSHISPGATPAREPHQPGSHSDSFRGTGSPRAGRFTGQANMSWTCPKVADGPQPHQRFSYLLSAAGLGRHPGDGRDLVRAVQYGRPRLVQAHDRPERRGGGGQPVAGIGGLVVLDHDGERSVGVAAQARGTVADGVAADWVGDQI